MAEIIDLYSCATPNGLKVHLVIAELDLQSNKHVINIRVGEQHHPEYLKLSPNNKIPVIVENRKDGSKVTFEESNNILIYLAEKYNKFLPTDTDKKYKVFQWIFFQTAHIGPMMGQLGHFKGREDKIEPAIERYTVEVNRLLGVVEKHLSENQYLANNEYSVADMANFFWIRGAFKSVEENVAKFPNTKAWIDRIDERPAVKIADEMCKIGDLPDQTAFGTFEKPKDFKEINLYDNSKPKV